MLFTVSVWVIFDVVHSVSMGRFCDNLQEFFENPAFRSDGLKIYPTLVIRGTGRCPSSSHSLFRLLSNVDIACKS